MEPSAQRSIFTLRDLLVLIALICLALAVLVPLARLSRQGRQRTECMNNLKQIGLGLHNYQDTYGELVPSYLTADHSPAAVPQDYATWAILIIPFVESTDFYEKLDVAEPLSSNRQTSAATDHALIRNVLMTPYGCPARRDPHALTRDGAGATGDYASVSRADLGPGVVPAEPRTWDGAMLPSQSFHANTASNANPVGVVAGQSLVLGRFRSVTTFASVKDGLSNTAFIGEKSVHADRLGGHPSGPAKTQLASQQDGTFYFGSGGAVADLKAPGAIAYWSRRLAPAEPQENLLPQRPQWEDPKNRFGGWHGDTTLFLIGDGSVRMVDRNTSTLVLQRLGSRNDGQQFKLPSEGVEQ